MALGGQRDQPRTPALGLREGEIDFASRGEGDGGVAVGKLLADGESGGADGAGRAKNSDFLHIGYFRRWLEAGYGARVGVRGRGCERLNTDDTD